MTELDINLTKSQADFLALEEPYKLFVAGLGSGKSYLMGLSAVLDAQKSPNALIGVYTKSHEQVRLVGMFNVKLWLSKFGLEEGRDYIVNKNEHTLTVNRPGWGSFLFKSYDDPGALVGYETLTAHVDELDTLATEKAQIVWDNVVSRNRQQLDDVPMVYRKWSEENQKWECKNPVSAYTSPEGFKFCYRQWVQNKSPLFSRVHGRTADNPHLSQDYVDGRASTMSPNLRLAYLEGQFVNLTAGTVYYCYDRVAHESNETVRPGETVFIGCDFNVSKQAATVFVRRNGGNHWHAVDEMVDMLDTPEMVTTITNRYLNKGHRVVMYPDASGGSRHSSNANASASDIAQLRAAGFEVRAKRRNPDVRDRIAATNNGFSNGVIFVNSLNCPNVARCLEQQAYNNNGTPDKDSGNDHQNDATTYPIAYEVPIKRPLYKIDFKFVV